MYFVSNDENKENDENEIFADTQDSTSYGIDFYLAIPVKTASI